MMDSICITYVYNMLPVDMEIISWAPTLVIYRNLMSPRQTASFLNFIEQRDLEIQKTSDFGTSIETTHRRANGSFIPPEDSNVTVEIKMQAQKRIPGLNLTVAEHFSALSYLPGGHYAVHYDYLDYRSKQDYDWWMNKTGNRIGTLIFVLKPAEKGGGTVFPSIGSTVRANAGDAFFWFNAQADEEKEMLSNHGGCPIYEGRKVIATIWIRAYNQRILPMAPAGSSIHASWLIPSLSNRFRPEMQTQSPVPN